MGVPALFRWLHNKYPKITSKVIDEKISNTTPDSNYTRIDSSLPNPNGIEFHNLYLDMNGIVHPCCHPEDKNAPETEEDMFLAIFDYMDRIFSMVRPRKLIYLAVDGVAPRAKMNQQRSRRFRAAQEAKEKIEVAEKVRNELRENGVNILEETDVKTPFDSNCITPGTKFMFNLSLALKYYIIERLNNDLAWKQIEVILSDSSVPGEGEHKIMEFIRKQRNSPSHDPNTEHVIYGLDADLIMLSLATHEPHFHVLREDVFFEEAKKFECCFRCGFSGHQAYECTLSEAEGTRLKKASNSASEVTKPFVFLDISVLREYLYFEFSHNMNSSFNFERMLDDWIFLLFFVGNDFLPHLPSMEIREGAIDVLIDIYKRIFPSTKDYLTDHGKINVTRVKMFLEEVGRVEDEIFQKRRDKEKRRLDNIKRRKTEVSRKPQSLVLATDLAVTSTNSIGPQKSHLTSSSRAKFAAKVDLSPYPIDPHASAVANKLNREAAVNFRSFQLDEIVSENESTTSVIETGTNGPNEPTSKHFEHKVLTKEDDTEDIEDDIQLWESGAKERYYQAKFHVSTDDKEFVKSVVQSYVEGLAWVMAYYYRGCVSWKWFYPFHYAPFASDFFLLDTHHELVFDLGNPLKPFEQLLGVLPAASRTLIPKPYHRLMTDEESELIDFYPESFPVDLNGKRFAWQGVALLPFIEETRLLEAAKKVEKELNGEEVMLNQFGNHILYLSENHSAYSLICKLYTECDPKDGIIVQFKLTPSFGESVDGEISKDPDVCLPGSSYSSALLSLPLAVIPANMSISALFSNPFPDQELAFPPELLLKVILKPKWVSYEDFLSAKYRQTSSRQGATSQSINQSYLSYRHTERKGSQFRPEKNATPTVRLDTDNRYFDFESGKVYQSTKIRSSYTGYSPPSPHRPDYRQSSMYSSAGTTQQGYYEQPKVYSNERSFDSRAYSYRPPPHEYYPPPHLSAPSYGHRYPLNPRYSPYSETPERPRPSTPNDSFGHGQTPRPPFPSYSYRSPYQRQ